MPYAAFTGLEYGQKAGRRVGAAILVSPLLLFSKKRKHFLTVSYNDASGKEQALILELGKDIIRTTLTVMETRSGKTIEYQDDEARKHGRGGALARRAGGGRKSWTLSGHPSERISRMPHATD